MDKYKSLADAISVIVTSYGPDIMADGNRFCAIIGDIAPNLEKELKILRRAKEEDIFNLLLDAYNSEDSDRVTIISKIEYKLKAEAGFSDEWYNCLINGFIDAFSWTRPSKMRTVPTTFSNSLAKKKKYFTKNIARNTFSKSPKQIVLPDKYNIVGERAFDYISFPVHTESITIPNGYVEIQRHAFHPLKIDHYISIPDSVVEIAENAFTLDKYAYVICTPNSYAYTYCTKHFLCNSVDGIPEKPEYNRINKSNASSIVSLASEGEFLLDEVRTLAIPKGTTSIEKGAFSNRIDIAIVLSDDNLKYIKKGAFAGCKHLRCIALGRGIKSIATDAFKDCTSLEIIFIDASDFHNSNKVALGVDDVQMNISAEAFRGCIQLKYIVSNDYCKQLEDFCRISHLTYVYDGVDGDDRKEVLPEELYQIMLYACIQRVKLSR